MTPPSFARAFAVLEGIKPVRLYTEHDSIYPVGWDLSDLVGRVTRDQMHDLLNCKLRVHDDGTIHFNAVEGHPE